MTEPTEEQLTKLAMLTPAELVILDHVEDITPPGSTQAVFRSKERELSRGESDILSFDKCLATAREFGIVDDPAAWSATGFGQFDAVDGGVSYHFDADLGMHGRIGANAFVEIHSADDASAVASGDLALAPEGEPE